MDNFDTFFTNESEKLSPSQAMRMLMSSFHYTREFEAGLTFVNTCRDLLNKPTTNIPFEEAQYIERDLTFMELSFYDYLNQWQQYLNFFEYIFFEKRSKPYIATYYRDPNQNPEERFGRYLFSYNCNKLQVHELYLCERQRAATERKLAKQKLGKNIEYLKRHQKEQLSNEEYVRRDKEMEHL